MLGAKKKINYYFIKFGIRIDCYSINEKAEVIKKKKKVKKC